jgi:ketosteroid isomerase-like protein
MARGIVVSSYFAGTGPSSPSAVSYQSETVTAEEKLVMTKSSSPALRVALAYHDAWTSKDMDRAMTYIADDIVCDAPAGRIESAQAYRAFMTPFVGMLLDSHMIAAFGDDETALVIYDTQTKLVESAPAAECVTVRDGKIVRSRFVFDRAPFDAARKAAQ